MATEFPFVGFGPEYQPADICLNLILSPLWQVSLLSALQFPCSTQVSDTYRHSSLILIPTSEFLLFNISSPYCQSSSKLIQTWRSVTQFNITIKIWNKNQSPSSSIRRQEDWWGGKKASHQELYQRCWGGSIILEHVGGGLLKRTI